MCVLCKKVDDQEKELWYKKYMILCGGHKNDKREFGKGYYISRRIMDYVLGFEPMNERIFKLSVKY